MPPKGFAFKPKTLKSLPEALKELPPVEDSIKPSPMTTSARTMFGLAAPAAAPKKKKNVIKPAQVQQGPQPQAQQGPQPQAQPQLEQESGAQEELELPPQPLPQEGPQEPTGDTRREEFLDLLGPDLREMADLIIEEEAKDFYSTEVPSEYVPDTRRGFTKFIRNTYSTFKLPEGVVDLSGTGERYYPYQRFVRDYMRYDSPYRGILVYHGLGSGKTCTSIATAEAIYAAGKKKIIVMAPKSLKKNFFREISFCGFRHFQLKNYWVPLDATEANSIIFANQVLGLSGKYIKQAQHIWVPDFRKRPEESNYQSLSDNDRNEIRRQILSIVDWDPVKNPSGRIKFISYNGITLKRLMEYACQEGPERFFDNSVIIIDEVHNLVRNITGKVAAYLEKGAVKGAKKAKRAIPPEPVTPARYRPTECNVNTKIYTRGYLLYRLLLDAQNSKIVALSGTPMINFPEELGVLSNILHGYIAIGEATFSRVADTAPLIGVGLKNKYIDYINIKKGSTPNATTILFTLLQPGLRKIDNDKGVERIPPEEVAPTLEDILQTIRADYKTAGATMIGDIAIRSEPLMPYSKEKFSQYFVNAAQDKAINQIVIAKRLTGLISYYKGSQLELMPSVKVDEIVRIPMGKYAQQAYSFRRNKEIDDEKRAAAKKKKAVDPVMAKIYGLADGGAANTYKMGSRQACNFAFPASVVRPFPENKKEEMQEAAAGVAEEINDAPADDREDVEEDELELEEGEGEDGDDVEQAERDDAEVQEMTGIGEEEEGGQEGGEQEGQQEGHQEGHQEGGAGEDDDELGVGEVLVKTAEALTGVGAPVQAQAQAQPPTAPLQTAPLQTAPKPLGVKEALMKAKMASCKTPRKPGETYVEACARAKDCLRTLAKENMKLGGPDGLEIYSPKYAEMLKRIAAAPGSSLVYSQFLDMEGIGIFQIAMDVNGYAPVEIVAIPGAGNEVTYKFSERTEASFKKGVGVQPRYMTFSGKEDEKIRGIALDIFNARFSELPDAINTVLKDAGYTDNKKGEICRVFCITSAGAEGISLRNVRAVHIMEPYWNEVRLRQVKGRAIRIGSHLDLNPEDRNVSIYTYITCYSDEAQTAKTGEMRIDEQILASDIIETPLLKEYGFPIKAGLKYYTLTVDEMLYIVSERKRKLIQSLETLMKSAAIDCELNYEQNKSDGFTCLSLEGKVGDFMYNPILEEDVIESARFMKGPAGPAAPAQPQETGPVEQLIDGTPNEFLHNYKGKPFLFRKKFNAEGKPIGFDMMEQGTRRIVGETGYNPQKGKPGLPVKFIEGYVP